MLSMTNNVIPQEFKLSRAIRNEQNKHSSFVVWFTGLSGSGKSSLANALEQRLFEDGYKVYVLDGDNIRLGINNDLDFTDAGRNENIRRVAEVAKLMVDAGIIVITSFISPFKMQRKAAKEVIGVNDFVEVFIDCPIEVCEQRDIKGLYKKARKGEIKHFTGINSPYEAPENPDISVPTNNQDIKECIDQIVKNLENKLHS